LYQLKVHHYRNFYSWVPYLGEGLSNSYFSEEDLPSDIIGFYAGYQRYVRGVSSEQIYGEIKDKCDSVGPTASKDVYEITYGNWFFSYVILS